MFKRTCNRSRYLALLLAAALALGLLPAAVYAAETAEYGLWVGGVQVTSEVTSGEGWSYEGDASKGTLTLSGANITGFGDAGEDNGTANIYNAGVENFTIALTGENKLSGADNGIVAESGCTTFTITGGSLDAKGRMSGISANVMDGLLKFEDAKIKAKGTSGGSSGIKCFGNMSISGCELTAAGASSDYAQGRGMVSWNLEIEDSKVEADCPEGIGLLVNGGKAYKLNVSGSSCVKVTGGADMDGGIAALMSAGGLALNDGLTVIEPENYKIVEKMNLFPAVGDSEGNYAGKVVIGKMLSVEVIPGEGMEITDGEEEQNVTANEAMESVILSADEDHYFPEDYEIEEQNGITVSRDSFGKITVSGTPTADTVLELSDAAAKAKEETPDAAFEADGYDSGVLRGLEPGMIWQVDDGEAASVTAEEITLTELGPCVITVITPASDADTMLDSEPQTIEITRAEKPELSVTQPSVKSKKGSVDTEEGIHEFSEDGESWTLCAGKTGDLEPGTYYVRVAASGAVLASDAQEIEIKKRKPAVSDDDPEPVKKPRHPFVDVEKGVWYDEAVQWAWENRVTDGVDETHFGPGATATRAQMVTFLWRAAGSPKASESEAPFTDIVKGSWYYDAVLWAYEKGITDGTSETAFSPKLPVTRSMTAAFLYRYEQSLGGGFKGLWAFRLDYPDAQDVPEYAYEPFCWLVKEDVIEGAGGKLIPLEPCLRSQIVTMMDRYFRK